MQVGKKINQLFVSQVANGNFRTVFTMYEKSGMYEDLLCMRDETALDVHVYCVVVQSA